MVASWITYKKKKKRVNVVHQPETPKEQSPPRFDLSVLQSIAVNTDKLKRKILEEDYESYVQWAWDIVVAEKLEWNWHMSEICSRVQEALERVMKGLPCDNDILINISPGTSKSLLCSMMPMGWAWAKFPSFKFICGSYSHELSLELSRRARLIVTSEKYKKMFPDVELTDDQNTKHLFVTTKGGLRFATSVGGSVIGYHAHAIILDDPVDPKRAGSVADLTAANKWIAEEISGRKTNKATSVTLLVQQRLGLGDPSEVMMNNSNVKRLVLPAENNYPVFPPELRDKYVDGLMDPKRLTRKVLDDIKRKIGKFAFAGQYGQSPIPLEGGQFLVDKFRREPTVPKCTRFCRFWDKAGSLGGGNFTVGVLMGVDEDHRYVVYDVIRFQLDSYARDEMMLNTAREDGIHVIVGIEQEGGSGGKQSVDITFRKMAGFNVKKITPNRHTAGAGKAARADAFSTQVNGGNVWLKPGRWNEEFIDEFKYFPMGQLDDQIDASVGAFTVLTQANVIRVGGMKASRKYMESQGMRIR